MLNSPGAGRKLQPGPGYDCCHGYHAEGCRVAPPLGEKGGKQALPKASSSSKLTIYACSV